EQVDIDDIKDKNIYSGELKWIAVQDRYFMSCIIPESAVTASMRLFLDKDNVLENQFVQPESIINPGTQRTFGFHLFMGPRSTKVVKEIGYDLDKAINFGMFDFLAKPCLWIMNYIYDHIISNYGIAIIVLTIFTKILLWPLGKKSYKSMNEMKKIQPLVMEIREKYKGDKKKMNEATMALYKTYKVNPVGGCLPMVLQIPVFFALYRMLYEAIELRHAPFFGWITDLSAPDRLFDFGFSIPFMQPPYGIPVLTIIMGATMFLQQKISPAMGDPSQAKIMMLMPIVFTVIFINFSSGLVLYWLVNNVLSITQQYYTTTKAA
ncbi:MAG: membrane protein insertase YidC, partial [Desulfobacterales bacterium]|nr:membrane protein insertase YidC [Desulfobacterales bacterium]